MRLIGGRPLLDRIWWSKVSSTHAASKPRASSSSKQNPRPTTRHGFSYYWETPLPTSTQLKVASKFFGAVPPKLFDSATKFLTVKETSMPEVAFLGRSNVGKSSLMNALMGPVKGKPICHTSKKPGRTRSMNFFVVGGQDPAGNPGKLALLDMPGYGEASREEWGTEILKYLTKRKQ